MNGERWDTGIVAGAAASSSPLLFEIASEAAILFTSHRNAWETTARMQEVEQRKEQLPRSDDARVKSHLSSRRASNNCTQDYPLCSL
jgi:hypothetical protein